MICLKLHLYFRDRAHSIQEWQKDFYEKYAVAAKYLKTHQKHPGLM